MPGGVFGTPTFVRKVCQLLVNSKSIRELLELTSRVCKVCFAKYLEKVLCGGKKRICRYLGFDSKRGLTNLGSNFSVIFPSLHSAYVTIRIPKRLPHFCSRQQFLYRICCLPLE